MSRIVVDRASAQPGDLVIPAWAADPDIAPLQEPGDEEFDGPLGSGWSQLGTSISAWDVNKTIPSALYFKVPAGATHGANGTLAGFMKPTPFPPPFIATVRVLGALTTPAPSGTANFLGVGLGLGAAGGAGGWTTLERGEQLLTGQDFEFNHWTDPSTYVNATAGDFEPNAEGWQFMKSCSLRLVADGSGSVSAYGSMDGLIYRLINTTSAPYAPGFTIGQVGLVVEAPAAGFAIDFRAAFGSVRFRRDISNPWAA